MNIFLILKCGLNDSAFFIQQLAQSDEVSKVWVFRDDKSYDMPKVKYIRSCFSFLGKFRFVTRFFQILLRKYYNPFVIVGIYEIPHGLIAMLAGKLLNKPSVVSFVSNPAYLKLRKGLRLKLTIWILNKCDFITVTGSKSRQVLVDKGFAYEKIFILPNTLDFNQFNHSKNCVKKYDIVSLGRLSPEKKVDQIVRIIAELKKVHPSIKAAIGGTGPEMDNIMTLINNFNLHENIDVCGFIPDEELSNFLSGGKVFLLTSETEGFPRTIIQAAACGAAIVSTKVGDIEDVIENNVDGFLVDSYKDIEGFVKYINELLSNQDKSDLFVNNLDKKVRSMFVHDKAIFVWRTIFDKINESKNT